MKSFIRSRSVDASSFPLIAELSTISKNTLINGMHNFFSGLREERVLPALELSAQQASTEEASRMYELFRAFTEANDMYAARHLVSVLEDRTSS